MATPNKQLEALLVAFATRPDTPPDAAQNLRNVIVGNPVLLAQLDAAAAAGDLKHFSPLDPKTHAGGTFDPVTRTMNLPLTSLRKAPNGNFDPANMAFVLGHEVQHGSNAKDIAAASQTFEAGATAIAKSKGPVHDYTPVVAARIEASRRDETKAEISGWNALRGALVAAGKTPTLALMYDAHPGRMEDFVAKDSTVNPPTYALKAGLVVAPDLSMPMSAANVRAMGAHYFDQPPEQTGIGANGKSDYPNYYGAGAVGRAIYLDRFYAAQAGVAQARIVIDFKPLRLREPLLEANGIDLVMNTGTPQKIHDSSTKPPTVHILQHTAKQQKPSPIEAEAPGFVAPEALQTSTRDAVMRLDASLGRSPDGASAAMTESLALLAARHGMQRVDEVALSHATASRAAGYTVFAIENGTFADQRRWVSLPTDRAVDPATAAALLAGGDVGGASLLATKPQRPFNMPTLADAAPQQDQAHAPSFTR